MQVVLKIVNKSNYNLNINSCLLVTWAMEDETPGDVEQSTAARVADCLRGAFRKKKEAGLGPVEPAFSMAECLHAAYAKEDLVNPAEIQARRARKMEVAESRQGTLCPSIDFCVIGKLYTAAQGAIARQCKGCAAYVQCLGSQQATSMCRNDPVDGALDDDSASDEGSDESSEKVKKAVARQGLPVDAISESVKTVTRSDEWKNYLENTIGVKVNHEANRHGRLGRNCYALYGMFRGCLMPSLCLGYSNV